MALLAEANYFGVEGLVRYLKEKEYHQSIRVRHTAEEIDDLVDVSQTMGADMEMEYHTTWSKEKVYVCPRGIFVHRGRPEKCGRQCRNAAGEEDEFEDETIMKMVRVSKQVIFDQRVLRGV